MDTSGFQAPEWLGQEDGARLWTERDNVLLWTCRAAHQLLRGEVIRAHVQTRFAIPPPARRVHFHGPVRVFVWAVAGDGSYVHQSGFALGTGVLGITLMAGTLAGNAVGNAARRQQAARDAQLAWRHLLDADIYVTDAGFALHAHSGLTMWPLSCLDMLQMVGPGIVVVQGRAADGPFSWQLQTPWAELVFVMWAIARHRDHPQFLDGGWLPPGWLRWARSQGKDPWFSAAQVPRMPPGLLRD